VTTISGPVQPVGAAIRLTLLWARCYSVGLRPGTRERRHSELESDLWEHYSDRRDEGASPAEVNIEVLGRLLRGMPSDMAWRFQAEGFNLNINFPVERLAGVLLLFLLVPLLAGGSIANFDTRSAEWPGSFYEFAGSSDGSRQFTQVTHAAIGILLIAAAALMLGALGTRSPRLVTPAAMLLGAGGLVMIMNSALYAMLSSTADDYRRTSDPGLIHTARNYAIGIETLGLVQLTVVSMGVVVFAFAAFRLGIVPRWALALSAVSLVSLVGAVVEEARDNGTAAWALLMVTWLTTMLWLLVFGVYLLVGGGRKSQAGLPVPSQLPISA